ncbi:MAG: uroporphyrinogen-III C-methyltransferase [Pseudotabrizicola sp.]|uniref:uroporphyrinogen-III C-methyltransferase n=1 Tax=Pseudotabrizicola sp. TaxID=2939647 RepID=UPI00272277F7|nr:uroporphyrinogen-III C-methyltransferase [Pseudotabrizicola sp.]MDO8882343.1 uroporphyrinogen-III C-methyltransferase [Pseudotabrizicola sp.]MDP2079785.1 uroporphyrinogen-III C-methyltransferase [Pseudotabrizicola sp.]MDZ7574786.1 uroporphyrinogen-III C-methyltransferase [Pseudotabrizicola sp.]
MTQLHQPTLPVVAFIGAGPGAAEHLTLGAYRAMQEADVVIHDRLVGDEVLALIPATALRVDAGKEGFGPTTPQSAINATLVAHAMTGARVVRLKGGDCGIFGRLDEEMDALTDAGITFRILPGLTSATVAAAQIGQSLTKRGRNASLRILTGHDMAGFAEQDWRGMARPGEVAAIYMGKKSARFIQGRLMMHGTAPGTDVTIVENVSRPDQRIIGTTLAHLPEAIAICDGPAVILFGLAPRAARHSLSHLKEA